jgi:hypothetical protein
MLIASVLSWTESSWAPMGDFGGYDKKPGAWNVRENGRAPPGGRRLDAGQELGSHQEAGVGLDARQQGKVQA